MPGEPDFRPFFKVPVVYGIAPDARLDPAQEATIACERVGTLRTAVLLPGTQFDASGTRHGRGGGWYDRFLAQVPEEWIRIGVALPEQFSQTALTRQSWDQPVDYVCVIAGKEITWHATHARFDRLD
jgi:5-formyltetrahydrofolate cyclo-ligase